MSLDRLTRRLYSPPAIEIPLTGLEDAP